MNKIDLDNLIEYLTVIIIILIITIGLTTVILTVQKRNIEKEITLMQIEVYGEPVKQEKVEEN